jgi:hypothetical protein
MAFVWPVYEGREPTRGGPWATLPAREAVALLALSPENYVSSIEETPRFGDIERDLWFAGYKHVIVEIKSKEAESLGLRAGFYESPFPPSKAYDLLVQRAVAKSLGSESIVRVEHHGTTDSAGREAFRITVVLTPEASKTLSKDDVALDAVVGVQGQHRLVSDDMRRLQQRSDDITPIVEFATEAELSEIDGP